ESAGNSAGSEAAQPEAVARPVAHSRRQSHTAAGIAHTGGKERGWAVVAAMRVKIALAPAFIITGSRQATARAALDHHGFFLASRLGNIRGRGCCLGQCLLSFIGSLDRSALESRARGRGASRTAA